MAKITYLIGAGASFNALPVVNDFPNKLLEVIRNIETIASNAGSNFSYPNTTHNDYLEALSDLKDLYKGCTNHMSVDTYARMLFLTSNNINGNKDLYVTTKWSIILFFELYRYFNEASSFDKRYDALLATILNTEAPMLPSDINVISWNYDYEFEKAFSKYYPVSSTIEEVYNEMNVLHKNHYKNKKVKSEFSIIKINGTSGYYDSNGDIHLGLGFTNLFSNNSPSDPTRLYPLIKNYLQFAHVEKLNPAISFSWENETVNQTIVNEVKNALLNTELLIVIGYSFPNFNRKIDKEIIGCFDSNNNPQYIYVQDPDADNIINRIKEFKIYRYRYKSSVDTKQFYLPPEF